MTQLQGTEDPCSVLQPLAECRMNGQQVCVVLYSSSAKRLPYMRSKWKKPNGIWPNRKEWTYFVSNRGWLCIATWFCIPRHFSDSYNVFCSRWQRSICNNHLRQNSEACPASSTCISNQWRCPQTGENIPRGRARCEGEDKRLRSTSIPLFRAARGRERPRASRVAPARPQPCPPRRLLPPPAHSSPPLRAGRGAAAGYKKLLGRKRRERRVAGAAGVRGGTGSGSMAQSVWGYDSENGERERGAARPGLALRWAGLGVGRPRSEWNARVKWGAPGGWGSQPGRRRWWTSLAFLPGPEHWHENYPMAKGQKQSPIEINSKDVRHDSSLASWYASYDPGAAKTILNNGRTCRVVFDDSFDRSGQLLFCLWGVIRNEGSQSAWNQSIPQQLAHTNEDFCVGKGGGPSTYFGVSCHFYVVQTGWARGCSCTDAS